MYETQALLAHGVAESQLVLLQARLAATRHDDPLLADKLSDLSYAAVALCLGHGLDLGPIWHGLRRLRLESRL